MDDLLEAATIYTNMCRNIIGFLFIFTEVVVGIRPMLQPLYHKSPCLSSGTFNVIAGLTQRECVCECFNQDRCSFLSYHTVMAACFLHSVLYSTVVQSDVNECFNLNVTEPEGLDYIESFNRGCPKGCSRNLPDPHTEKCVNCVQSGSKYETQVNIDNCCNSQEPGITNESGTSEQYCTVCNRPSDVENATLRSELTGVGWSTSYACQDGYTMVGNPVITCTETGSWSLAYFRCYRNCPEPSVEHAERLTTLMPRIISNTSVTFQCNMGYYNITTLNSTCNDQGRWFDITDLKCLKYCPDPPIIASATRAGVSLLYTVFSTVTYTCEDGWYLHDLEINSIKCLETGVWSTPTPKCNWYCSSPSVTRADIIDLSPRPYTIHSFAKFQCNWGTAYDGHHEGVGTLHCNEQGSWYPAVKCCIGNRSWWNANKNGCCNCVRVGCIGSC